MTCSRWRVAGYAVTLALVGSDCIQARPARVPRARPLGIIVHALGSAIGRAIGPSQLDRRPLVRRRRWHHNLGKVYMAVLAHREWMIRSYSILFAAVTLQLELPVLIVAHAGAFTPACRIGLVAVL